MGYSMDLQKFSLEKYAKVLKHQNLLPGRRILLEELDAKFQKIASAGVENLAQLKSGLSTSQKLSAFAAKTDIPEDYLAILKREMGSLEQKPVPLADFPGVSEETVHKLTGQGIKTSKDFYLRNEAVNSPQEMSDATGVAAEEIDVLCCMCNLVRINGVGAAAAKTLCEGGYKSVAEIAAAQPQALLDGMERANATGGYYSAKLGLKDMQFIIDFARLLKGAEENEA